MKRIKKLANDLVRDIGEYLVCHVLPHWGIHAVKTQHNAKGVDVVAYCRDTLCSTTIQVKTYTSEGATAVCEKTDGCSPENDPIFRKKPIAEFWVFVSLDQKGNVRSFYVWHSKDKHLLVGGKDGDKKVWRINPHQKKGGAPKEWKARKGDSGLRRLAEFLNTPASDE